ncbi:MAG: type II secretion system protein [Candidatus Omnitrophica bacterium]|jgi:type II secretory pathway pseudopilin PulG|nr:type II secretion system protein [Candidatus Omnitrophota bacterium]
MGSKKKAFSLIEIMISIMVLMATLPALLLGFINYFALNRITEDFTVATADASRIIEQMRSLSVNSLANIASQDWVTWAANNGCTSLPSEQAQVTYTDRDASGDSLDDNPLAVTVTVSWQRNNRTQSLSFATLITER